MNAHYTFPNAFDTSSPNSVSPPSSVSSDYTLTPNPPSHNFPGEFDTLEQHSMHAQQPGYAQGTRSTHNSDSYTALQSNSSSRVPSPGSAALTDFDFANSLRTIRGSRGDNAEPSTGDGPTESEAAVAETIVRARKSWKTVKGRSEPVWPPHLEKALVQALLQYKPHDSRYARALGRFPKRNRYISDYIYNVTGVRRSPKQVGSRLQQLKDVTCGKMLLNHVANWSLASTPSMNDATVSPASIHPNLSDIIGDPNDHGSEGSLSPVSPHPGAREASLTGMGLKPYSNHSALYLSSAQIRGGLSGSSAPSSPFDSPPLTPMVRTMNVIVPFDPTDDGDDNKSAAKREERVRPIVRFGGCLALPETVYSLEPSTPQQTLGRTEPRSTFVSRDPIPAQSVARVWVHGTTGTLHSPSEVVSPSGPVQSPMTVQGKGLSGYGSRTLVNELSEPLVCTQTPVARASSAQTSFYSVDKISAGRKTKDADDRECFVYATRLVDDPTWRAMRREGDGLSRYTITQELMHSFNSANTKRGETFLSITYHFVPISQYAMHPSAFSTLSPLDMRGINYGHGHVHSSVSPVSSSSSSPLSASPSSMMPHSLHFRQVPRMHSYSQGTYAPHDHMYSQSQASRRVPELSVVPSLPSISQSGNMMNSFNHDAYYTSAGSPASGSFSGCNIDFNSLDIDNFNLNTHTDLDRPLL